MRIPMPAEREETRMALEAALIRVCDLPDNLNIIHNEIVGNVIEMTARLPEGGWPFARLCGSKSVENFMAMHEDVLEVALLAKHLPEGEEKRRLESDLLERDFARAFQLGRQLLAEMDEERKEALMASEKSERLYFRPELRCEIYIVLNQKLKFIFNMQSALTSGLTLLKPKKYPRTCAAVPTLEDVRELILINLAQIRPDVAGWLNSIGLALLDEQKFRCWRG